MSLESPYVAGIILRDDKRDELLVFGFINQCFRNKEMINVQILPVYLIKLIRGWVCIEMVHLIAWTKDWDRKYLHWKINVDDILTTTTV